MKKDDALTSRRSVAVSENICPFKSKLVDDIVAKQAVAEVEESRPDVDIDSVYWKRKRKKSRDKK
jgi:hypothetical protein